MRKTLYQAYCVALLALLTLPEYALGQGLVPECSRTAGSRPCEFCDVVLLVNNVVTWLVGILGVIGAIIIAYAGILLVVSGGNTSAKESAKQYISNILIGYVIILAAWLLIDLGFKSLVNDQQFGVWNQIQCVGQPRAEEAEQSFINLGKIDHPTLNASRGTAYSTASTQGMTEQQIRALAQNIASIEASEADALIAQTAAELGIPGQASNLQALMRVESGGCQNNRSQVGALGCMQIMPGTAKQYDPSLRNLTNEQVAQKLLDPAYNIPLGVKIYQDLYNVYDGDTTLIFAGYNGGPGANEPSEDCGASVRKWECEWDNPQQTVRNTGYQETRDYVRKVAETANNL